MHPLVTTPAFAEVLFRHAPAVVSLLRGVGERVEVVTVSEELRAATGWTIEEVEGRAIADLVPPGAAEEYVARFREALERGSTTFEFASEVPAGRRTYQVTMARVDLPDTTDPHVMSLGVDVTAQRQAAAALDETQRLARIGHWSLDLVGGEIRWTPQMHEIWGIPEGVPLTMDNTTAVIHPDDRPALEANMERAIAELTPYEMDLRIVRDGEVRTVIARASAYADESGRTIRLAGTAQDVTEARAAEQASESLERARQRQVQALELNDDVVQGLATARLALMQGETELALETIDRTLDSARSIIDGLLGDRAATLGAGDLVRTTSSMLAQPRGSTP